MIKEVLSQLDVKHIESVDGVTSEAGKCNLINYIFYDMYFKTNLLFDNDLLCDAHFVICSKMNL